MKEWISGLKDRVLGGGDITREEAAKLLSLEDASDIEFLLGQAHLITQDFHSEEPSLCSLINAKSNMCGEDCGFCSQSVRFETQVDRYSLMSPEEVLKVALSHEKQGTKNFCIVTSGASLSNPEFEQALETIRLLKRETKLNIDGSLGFLTPERVTRLKEAGMRRFNSNLQTSREFYPEIVTTHTYATREATLKALQAGDMEICSGGILGMGETREDRVSLAFELKPYHPECLPINILNPRPGTPLENAPQLETVEVLKTIAMFRFVLPEASIKLAGGREANLTEADQERALRGGANGMIIGGYLTTEGNPMRRDSELLKRAGYKPFSPAPAVSSAATPTSCCG